MFQSLNRLKAYEKARAQQRAQSLVDDAASSIELIKDDEIEDLILRETDMMDQFVLDCCRVSERSTRSFLKKEFTEKLKDLWPTLTTHKQRKVRILTLLREHPSLGSVNPDILCQRIVLYEKMYGPQAKQLHINDNPTPINTTLRLIAGIQPEQTFENFE